jgi:hypothetical protein
MKLHKYVAPLVVAGLLTSSAWAADPTVVTFPSTIGSTGTTAQETNFYKLNLDTFTVPNAQSLITAVSGNKVFIGERTSRTLYLATIAGNQITLQSQITVPPPLSTFHKSNSIIDLLATSTKLYVVAVDGASTYPACGAAKIYEYSIASLATKPRLLFTSDPCVRGELFWDARVAIHGNDLFIAGGNSLVDYATGIFPGPDSVDYISGEPFPKTNFFGSVSMIDLKTKKVTTIANGLRHLGGLYYDEARKVLWEDENGPRGGDELNIIIKGKNYGWPQTTLGRSYDVAAVNGGVIPNSTGKSQEPIYGWTPSISPSTVRKIAAKGEFAKYWAGDLIVGSLKGHELRRLRISKTNTVMYDEPIPVGDRIRSLDQLNDGRLLLATDSGTLILVSDSKVLPTGRYPAGN